jgi:hypothetical protein
MMRKIVASSKCQVVSKKIAFNWRFLFFIWQVFSCGVQLNISLFVKSFYEHNNYSN